MTTPDNSSFSTLSLLSTDPHLRRSFLRRFPTTRESYGRPREREVLATISGSTAWRRVGKPYFRHDVITGIVFREAPASRLSPACRITVCVPYEVAFHVAVRTLNLSSLSLLSVNS
jgi:hypothetical protein